MHRNKTHLCSMLLLLTMFFCSTSLVAQSTRSISGVVKDELGDSMIAITVYEKGTSNGTITDFDGNFQLSGISDNSVIIFSFIGYKTQEIAVGNQSVFNVTMEEDTQLLEDVVVIGYGSVDKSDLTGSVSSVDIENLPSKPANSVEGLLQGQSAGVQITNSSDDPGAGAVVRIRGGSSLNAGNDPLVVVDGFPLGNAGDMKQISPSDIASIEILKDASASAIYGSRGANGVIMITLKKGKGNKMNISVTEQVTVSDFTSKLNLWRDPVLMAELSNESRLNGGFNPLYIGAEDSNGIYYPSVGELRDGSWSYRTNWDEVVFRTPVSNNTNIAIRNQTDKTQYSLSATYYTDQGVYVEDDFQKLNINMNINHNLTKNLKVGSYVVFSTGDRNNNGGLAYWRNSVFPIYNENDPAKGYYMLGTQDYSHPLALTEKKTNTTDYLDFIGTVFGEWQIIPSLSIRSQVNYKFGRTISEFYNPKIYTLDGTFNNGAGGINNWEAGDLVSETILTYDEVFNEKHHLNAMAGFSYQYYKSTASELRAYDFLNESLGSGNLGMGNPEKQSVANALSETVMYSYLGRINYEYASKYLATVTLRTDGSSKFGQNNRYAMFPSGAIGWKMHHEEFIKNLDVFDELKIRASYGVSGNQGISPYLINSRYGDDKYFADGKWNVSIGPGYTVGWDSHTGKRTWGGIPNPDLKWESTQQYNVGLDLAFLRRRLRFTLDYYNKYTTDLLRERWLSPSSSYDKMWVNSGDIRNQGFEATVAADIVDTKDWGLTASLMFSHNQNEVVSLGSDAAFGLSEDANTGMKYEFYGNTIEAYRAIPSILGVGQPVGVFYGYRVGGIVQTEAEGLAAGLEGDNAQPGEYKYVDLNEDGIINENDRTIIGNPNPDFTASLNMNLRWRDFDLSLFFNGAVGGEILNTKAFGEPSNMPLRWTMDNPTNAYPSLRDGRQVLLSDWFVQDGSYLRFQNLTVGYKLPNFNSKYFNGGRISFNATNLFTLSNFEGYDPEVGTDGIYWGGYPKLRKYTVALELNF